MASFVYNNGMNRILDGTCDLSSGGDTIKCMLVQAAYVADPDHVYVEEAADDANEHEVTVTGYTEGYGGAGRVALTSQAISTDDANDLVKFDAADITWTTLGAGETIAGACLIQEVTNDAASFLIMYLDFTNKATDGGDFPLVFSTDGIATFNL